MASKAQNLKDDGNKYFAQNDFQAAESLYSQAIQIEPNNAIFLTNRAFARIKLAHYESAEEDCHRVLEIAPQHMKAHFHLARAQLELRRPREALTSALCAYGLCLRYEGASATQICALILRAKKARWEAQERERKRLRGYLVVELEERLDMAAGIERMSIDQRIEDGELDAEEGREELAVLEDLHRRKIEELRSVFAVANTEELGEREVPDYMIDSISFNIMHDPVITKQGKSYERSTLMEHLRQSETDPLTREHLTMADLRPNLALKEACNTFLDKNGWAVDY